MFEQFSSSYYLGRLYVEPRAGEPAQMCREQHQRVNRQLYGGQAAAPADQPLVMKLGTRHFPVRGGEGIPADTLAVPPGVLDDVDLRNPPSLREVLLANADRAAELLRLTGGVTPEPPGPPDADGSALDPGSPSDGPDGPAGI
jgi:hypothetical protein